MALRITVPETFQTSAASIRITFDGSEPDAGSEAYDGGDIILPDAGCVKTDFERNDRNLSVSVVRAACFDGDGNRDVYKRQASSHPSPVQISGAARAGAAGSWFSAILNSDGSVTVWGKNTSGISGTGETSEKIGKTTIPASKFNII